MIIHSEPRTRAFLAHALAAEGLAVDIATNGPHGLTCALARRYELALLGIVLHDRDGFEVLRELNRQEQDLPVIVVSRRGDLATKLRGFELGAVDCVSHPFSLEELLARVRVHLRHPRPAEGSQALRVGNLELDLVSRQALVGDVQINLPNQEFRVLSVLIKSQGQLVSRERLLSEVWGYDFEPGSNVVEVCVRRIRQRLGRHAQIETVRNAGYRAVA